MHALANDTDKHKPCYALGLGLPLTDLDVIDPRENRFKISRCIQNIL